VNDLNRENRRFVKRRVPLRSFPGSPPLGYIGSGAS